MQTGQIFFLKKEAFKGVFEIGWKYYNLFKGDSAFKEYSGKQNIFEKVDLKVYQIISMLNLNRFRNKGYVVKSKKVKVKKKVLSVFIRICLLFFKKAIICDYTMKFEKSINFISCLGNNLFTVL